MLTKRKMGVLHYLKIPVLYRFSNDVVLIIFIAVSIVCLCFRKDEKVKFWMDEVLMGKMRSVMSLASYPVDSLHSVKEYVVLFFNYTNLVDELMRTSDRLEMMERSVASIEMQNSEMRDLLGVKSYIDNIGNAKLKSGHVIFRDKENLHFFVDLGIEDGVRVGDIVVNRNGMIGKVVAVMSRMVKVMDIRHPRSVIPVMIKDKNLAGLAFGNGNRISLQNFVPVSKVLSLGKLEDGGVMAEEVTSGDIVLTSPENNLVLPFVPIGTVRLLDDGDERVDFNNLEVVPYSDISTSSMVMVVSLFERVDKSYSVL